jgi:hypothetical protein
MAWVRYEGKLFRLPLQRRMTPEGFRIFQEKNQECEILIYAPEGGHDVVPLSLIEFEEFERNER